MMLSIIWGILKVTGIVLLVILALILVLLFTVLFVPLRYEFSASGKYDKEAEEAPEYLVKARVSWLLRLVSVRILAGGTGMQVKVRLFGIPVGGRKGRQEEKPSEKSRKKKKRRERNAQAEQTEQAEKQTEEQTERKKNREKQTEERKKRADEGAKERQNQAEQSGREELPEKKPLEAAEKKGPLQKLLRLLRRLWEFFAGFFQNLRTVFEKICGTIKRIFGMLGEIREFLEAEENREAFRYVKGEAGRLLRHVLPGKLSGEIRFGLEDPAAEGRVLMALGIAYPLIGSRLSVTPVFENKLYVEGSLFFKGRIRAFSLLIIGIRVWFNKKFRGLLKRGRGLKEQLGRA